MGVINPPFLTMSIVYAAGIYTPTFVRPRTVIVLAARRLVRSSDAF